MRMPPRPISIHHPYSQKPTKREKAIKKEQQYAERKFRSLVERFEKDSSKLDELDTEWKEFCHHLISLKKGGEDEFRKYCEGNSTLIIPK